MVDPFETVVLREQITKIGAWALLCAIVVAVSYCEFSTVVTDGKVVNAEVLRLEMYPTGRGNGGDIPILSGRLPDGSTRLVRATWADVDDCTPGHWIALRQQGTALQVGKPGCKPSH